MLLKIDILKVWQSGQAIGTKVDELRGDISSGSIFGISSLVSDSYDQQFIVNGWIQIVGVF